MNILRMTALPVAAISLALLAVQAAHAHTELAATVPEDKAEITQAPEDLQLTFSAPVRLTAVTIQLDGAPKQSLGPLPAASTTDFTIALPTLTDGHYVVTWRALSADTHVINGEFMFAIGAAVSSDAQVEHGEASDAPAAHSHSGHFAH